MSHLPCMPVLSLSSFVDAPKARGVQKTRQKTRRAAQGGDALLGHRICRRCARRALEHLKHTLKIHKELPPPAGVQKTRRTAQCRDTIAICKHIGSARVARSPRVHAHAACYLCYLHHCCTILNTSVHE